MSERRGNLAEFERLLMAMTDGELNGKQRGRLETLVGTDRDCRTLYLDWCQMHALLRLEFGELGEGGVDASGGVVGRIGGLNWDRRWMSVAAMVMFAVSVWWLGMSMGEDVPVRGEVVATMNSSSGSVFGYGGLDGSAIEEGDGVRAGYYELKGGVVELSYTHGATMIVEAPARFELVDDNLVKLEFGRVSAKVPEAAIGFTVETPSANVVDLGTEFGVSVDGGANSEVHVFKGEVVVEPIVEEQTDPVRLVEAQASRFDKETSTPAGIDLATGRFLRQLDEPETAYSTLVREMNPIVYYTMRPSKDGKTLVDGASSRYPGEIIQTAPSRPLWSAGMVGTAISFVGPTVRDYVVVKDYPKADEGKLAVTAWVYANSRVRWASIAKNWGHTKGVSHGQFQLGLLHDMGGLNVDISDDSGNVIRVTEDKPLPLNRWHHVAFVADGKRLRLYRNGQPVGSVACGGVTSNEMYKALGIGTRLNATGKKPQTLKHSYWHGRLDEVAVFNHGLSSRDIRELYRAGVEGHMEETLAVSD